ncbi:MAG: hypothetical protein AB7I01_12055 [Gammaproteobacteria bacterium]
MHKDAIVAACAALVCAAGNAEAATLVDFTFDDGSTVLIDEVPVPVFVNPRNIAVAAGITNVSAWSDRDGAFIVTTETAMGGLRGKPRPGDLNDGRAAAARSFGAGSGGANQPGNELIFTFDVLGVVTIDGFKFDEQGSSGGNGRGPSAWKLFVSDDPLGIDFVELGSGTATRGSYGTHCADPTGADCDGTLLDVGGLTGTITVRILATGAENDDRATWRVDNFQLTGTVAPVPLPATLPLLAAGAGLLALRRRRG